MTTAKQPSKQILQATKAGKIVASYSKSHQGGFTIIESLVAIVVVSILLAAIAPVIILSVATRVQARRIEFATQAAKSYIDGVRTKQIEPPAPPAIVAPATEKALSTYDAPTNPGSFNCAANSYCTTTGATSTGTPPAPTNLYCIDFDGVGNPNIPNDPPKCHSSSTTDMVVQVFRNKTSATGYALGVRVYRANAFKSGVTFKASKDTNVRQQQTFTGGTGLGNQQAPLVEMSTDINDTIPSYSDLCNRLQGCSN
ncbi:MAG: hormogonium polysaccharide secretion pseudopilin HpsB [Hassallia sp.]